MGRARAALGRLRALSALGLDDSRGERIRPRSGIATYRQGDRVASLLSRADAEMYAEKARRAAGRPGGTDES